MKKWKPILALILVFVAGTIFGIVATRVITRAVIRRMLTQPELVRVKIERDLNRKLRLDAQQSKQVHEALINAQQKLVILRKDFQPQFGQIISNAQEQIAVVLTPEQREKFEHFKDENRRILPLFPKNKP